MAARIKEAVPEKGTAQRRPVPAVLYEKARHGNPRCAGCGAKLKHVPTYSKYGGSTQVSAYFGLNPGHKHALGCKYDIDATLRQIVAKSREVRGLGAAVLVEYVGSPEQGAVEFRLNVLMMGLELDQFLGRRNKDPERAYAYSESERRLTTYMNCVESIIMVADVIGDHARIEEKVHIVFKSEKIPWRDFFFSLQEHLRLWGARDKTKGRPVTLEFKRRDLERNAPAPYSIDGHYQISSQFEREEADPPYNVQVQLQVEDKALADAIWKAKQVAVCGIPRFRAPDFTRRRTGGCLPFAHIVLPVRHWSQVFTVGGGSLKVPPSATYEQPAHVAPRDTATNTPAPSSDIVVTGVPTREAWPSLDATPNDIIPDDLYFEPEEEKLTGDDFDEAQDVAGSDIGEKVPSSIQADPESNLVSLDFKPLEPEAEAPENAEKPGEWEPETEKAVARSDDDIALAQMAAVAPETPQPTATKDPIPVPAASAGPMPEQDDAQPLSHEAAIAASSPTFVVSDARPRRSRGSMAWVAKAVKQRAAKIVERSRSAGRRFLAWLGGNG